MCCVLVEVRYGVRRSIARMSAHTGQLAVPRDITVPCIFLLSIVFMTTDKNEVIAFFVYQAQRQTIVVCEWFSPPCLRYQLYGYVCNARRRCDAQRRATQRRDVRLRLPRSTALAT